MSAMPGLDSRSRARGAAGGWLHRIPLTLALTAATVIAGIFTGGWGAGVSKSHAGTWGFQAKDILDGQGWSVLTTLLPGNNPASLLAACAVLLGLLGLAETTLGTSRALMMFVGSQLGAVVLYTLIVEVGSAAGMEWLAGMREATLFGPFAAATGALMAASRGINLLWRRRVRALTFAAALMFSLYVGHAQNIFILLGAIAGLLLGIIFVPSRSQVRGTHSTSREVRTTLAIVVSVFAVGPLMAALAHIPVGPLARLRNLVVNPVPAVSALRGSCTALETGCQEMALNGGSMMESGAHLLALVPMLLLLVCAEGLRRGNRMALWAGVYMHLVIGITSAIYLQVFATVGMPLHRGRRVLSVDISFWEVLPVVLVPFLIGILLFVFRRHFHIDPDPVLRRRTFSVLSLVLAGFILLYSVVWLLEGNAGGHYGLLGLLAGLPRLLLPYPFPSSYAAAVYPHGEFSRVLFTLGGGIFWLVSVLGVFSLFVSRRVRGSGVGERPHMQALVRRGGGSLSWMVLWPNNHYWFNPSGTVAIAYQAHAGVAVTVGGPVGDPAHYDAAVLGFLDHCEVQSLAPCFYSVTDECWEVLHAQGFRRAQVATETLLDIAHMEFTGKEWQNVRTALNKAAKLGISTVWARYSELSTGLRTQILEISEEWVSGKALPEMGFTLGGVQELKDDAVQLCLAVDATGRVHGLTSWLPVFVNGEESSWTLDFMRRNQNAFNGVMEYLIAQAVLNFQGRVPTISLSASPLSIEPDAQPVKTGQPGNPVLGEETPKEGIIGRDGRESRVPGATDLPESAHPLAALESTSMKRILALLARTLEPLYGFASLANFKRRFQPRHRTLYMMYQDPLSLPAIGRAVGQAYMPNVSMRQLAKLLRQN